MKIVFADPYYLLALFNPSDQAQPSAVKWAAAFTGRVVLTDWVLTEFADALCEQANRASCVKFLEDLRRSPDVEIAAASREGLDAAWALYKSRPDKNWSLTDCTSFVVRQRNGIRAALTGDRHFEQAGFRALLKE